MPFRKPNKQCGKTGPDMRGCGFAFSVMGGRGLESTAQGLRDQTVRTGMTEWSHWRGQRKEMQSWLVIPETGCRDGQIHWANGE